MLSLFAEVSEAKSLLEEQPAAVEEGAAAEAAEPEEEA